MFGVSEKRPEVMTLPEGITGFIEAGVASRLPRSIPRRSPGPARRRHARNRATLRKVRARRESPCNCHRATYRLRDAAIAVLCNAHFPWIAFAEASDDFPLRFIEATTLAARIKDSMPCEVVGLSSLEAPPDAGLLAGLGAVERDQIRYWRPQRLGGHHLQLLGLSRVRGATTSYLG